MSTIASLFIQAQLAEASYATFIDSNGNLITTNTGLIGALIESGFSQDPINQDQSTQAAAFVQKWRVVDQYIAPGFFGTGFSATVFQDRVTGEYVFSLRGTETFNSFPGLIDLSADIGDILVDGLALDQIVDMYNYWQSLTHAGTYQAAQLSTLTLETVALKAAYGVSLVAGRAYEAILRQRSDIIIDSPTHTVRTVEFVASSELSDPRLRTGSGVLGSGAVVNVDGHSLGGHLAMAFSRLFPDATNSVVAVNGAGFNLANSNVDHLFSMLAGPSTFDASKITNVVGSAAMNLVSQDWLFLQQPAERTVIYTESALPGAVFGHGSSQMTDSLAIYDLFAKVDPALNTPDPKVGIDRVTGILEAMSNAPALTLEAALDSLRALFKEATVQSVVPTPKDQREAFYQNLNDTYFQNRISGYTGLLSIESLVGKDVATIEANAFGGIAFRYALKALNPFVVLGEDGIYDQFNQSSELDVYDSVTGAGTLTSQWIFDRAGFITRKIEVNTADKLYAIDASLAGSVWYQDKRPMEKESVYVSSTALSVDPLVVSNHNVLMLEHSLNEIDAQRIFFGFDSVGDSLHGDAGADFLYGGGGNDVLNSLGQNDYLQGDIGDDQLYGGGGDDTLVGGKDTDQLDGGLGDDTYVWNRGDGFDTIIDARENVGTGVKQGTIQFLNQSLAGTKTQVDPTNPGLFTDEFGVLYAYVGVTWEEGTLVIVKQGEEDGLNIRGFKSGDFGIVLGPVAPIQKTDKFGTALADDGSDPESPLYNDAPNQKIFALDGDDGIFITTAGTEGYGGEGQDFIYAPDLSGGHKLYGEGGRDILIAWGSELYGGLDDDALTVGVGEDYLEGNEGSDVLAGNLGQDVLVGGGGNDYLLGGSSYSAGNFLVDAMAAFAPPAPGQTDLPPDYATQLNPTIAANWQ